MNRAFTLLAVGLFGALLAQQGFPSVSAAALAPVNLTANSTANRTVFANVSLINLHPNGSAAGSAINFTLTRLANSSQTSLNLTHAQNVTIIRDYRPNEQVNVTLNGTVGDRFQISNGTAKVNVTIFQNGTFTPEQEKLFGERLHHFTLLPANATGSANQTASANVTTVSKNVTLRGDHGMTMNVTLTVITVHPVNATANQTQQAANQTHLPQLIMVSNLTNISLSGAGPNKPIVVTLHPVNGTSHNYTAHANQTSGANHTLPQIILVSANNISLNGTGPIVVTLHRINGTSNNFTGTVNQTAAANHTQTKLGEPRVILVSNGTIKVGKEPIIVHLHPLNATQAANQTANATKGHLMETTIIAETVYNQVNAINAMNIRIYPGWEGPLYTTAANQTVIAGRMSSYSTKGALAVPSWINPSVYPGQKLLWAEVKLTTNATQKVTLVLPKKNQTITAEHPTLTFLF